MIVQSFAIQLPELKLTPQLAQGDREFWGNGPRFVANTSLARRGNKLFVRVIASWIETGGDVTTFEGDTQDMEILNLDTHPRYAGWDIDAVNGNPTLDYAMSENYQTVLRGWGTHPIIQRGTTMVSRFDVVGDSYGGPFGGDDHPEARIMFRPIDVRIKNETLMPPPARQPVRTSPRVTLGQGQFVPFEMP